MKKASTQKATSKRAREAEKEKEKVDAEAPQPEVKKAKTSTELVEKAQWRKVERGQKQPICLIALGHMMDSAIDTNDFIFFEPTGTTNHVNINFFSKNWDSPHLGKPFVFEFGEEHQLPFGITSYKNQENAAPVASVTLFGHEEDKHHFDRLNEVQSVVEQYLLSPDAATAWALAAVPQPRDKAELNFQNLITVWTGKKSKQEYTDVRIKFQREFNGLEKYNLTDHSIPEEPRRVHPLHVEGKQTLKGTYTFGPIYIRPTPRGKVPYITGVTVLAKDIHVYPDPESQIQFV